MHRLHLPETIAMQCLTADRGWLLLMATEDVQVFLLNPLTRARIHLPPFTARVDQDDFAIHKVAFSAHLTDPNCMIMLFLAGCRSIYYCRIRDRCWTMVNCQPNPIGTFTDATCYNGRFYLLYDRALAIIDSSKPEKRIIYPLQLELCDGGVNKHFLEGKSGVYLFAVFPWDKFALYQFREQPMQFMNTTGLSNTAIFHGDNNYFLAVCSDNWDLLDGTSLYTYSTVLSTCKHALISRYNIYCVKRHEGKIHTVVTDLGDVPLDSPLPALWFQPSFD